MGGARLPDYCFTTCDFIDHSVLKDCHTFHKDNRILHRENISHFVAIDLLVLMGRYFLFTKACALAYTDDLYPLSAILWADLAVH